MNNFEAFAPPVPTSSLTRMTVMGREWDQKLYVTEKPDLSRLEEWVSSRDSASIAFDGDIVNDRRGIQRARFISPTTPASTFSAGECSLLLN